MTLRNVLLINAISSGITGILLAAMPAFFANLFNVIDSTPFAEIGVFLILFSSFVLWTAFKNPIRQSWTKFIIGMDITWVVASIVTVFILFTSISIIGIVIILAVAGWVGTMAYLQGKTSRII
jgi:multisubunit Na+/H+ antiporter MnhF subunit